MGLLGRSEIVRVLRSRELVVTPILSPDQIGAASIDLRMGTVIIMARARGSSHVDPSAYKAKTQDEKYRQQVESDRRQKYERYEVPFEDRFLLHPGALVLVPTLEWLKLPRTLHGSVTARSTWAREGLSIATATFVEPGYQGIVTLELANMGDIPMALYPGMRVAQIAFSGVDGIAERPNKAQFLLAFEPEQGATLKDDEYVFIRS